MVTVDTDYEYRSRSATALNELAILDTMGREGWEVIDLGPFNLHFRRPRVRAAVVPWEYARRTALPGAHVRQAMRAQGWGCTGDWVLFHYLKRPRTGAY
jgi:hypothetical protein